MSDAEYDKLNEFKESPASTNQGLFNTNDESVKREHFERNFLQLKTTCSTLFDKLTTRISNYYIVTKNGMNTYKDATSTAVPNLKPTTNQTTTNQRKDQTNDQTKIQTKDQKIDQIKDPINDQTINQTIDQFKINNSSTINSSLSNNILNRNLTARRSSRSNLGSSANEHISQQFKMTRDQLSPTVNAQCLSPRPRPRECRCLNNIYFLEFIFFFNKF